MSPVDHGGGEGRSSNTWSPWGSRQRVQDAASGRPQHRQRLQVTECRGSVSRKVLHRLPHPEGRNMTRDKRVIQTWSRRQPSARRWSAIRLQFTTASSPVFVTENMVGTSSVSSPRRGHFTALRRSQVGREIRRRRITMESRALRNLASFRGPVGRRHPWQASATPHAPFVPKGSVWCQGEVGRCERQSATGRCRPVVISQASGRRRR
jgi:hypothetical protein